MSIATPPRPATHSLAESMSLLNDDEREQLLATLSEHEADELLHDWLFWARPQQLPPEGNWRVWLVMAGRGFGKTRTGAEWVRESAKHFGLVNIVGATADDARDIMIEGESGILAICPDHERPNYLPSKRRLEWPNGARSLIFTADEPERLRGKQHERLWCDEVAAWRYGTEAWDQAMFGLRLGLDPKCVATTTPKPVAIIRSILDLATTEPDTIAVTRGSSYENVDNLAPAFFSQIIRRYEGTRLGRQELSGELLEDVEGAFWSRAMIESTRVRQTPELRRIVVAIDPATTHGDDADFTGIVVAGLSFDDHVYVIHAEQVRLSPDGWARRSIALYDRYQADSIIAERNQGGEMVEHTIRTVRKSLRITTVHASRGKVVRAEPVVALYEQNRAHHVGTFAELEDQMCSFPVAIVHEDILDALVYAVAELDSGDRTLLRGRA